MGYRHKAGQFEPVYENHPARKPQKQAFQKNLILRGVPT